MLSKLNLQRIVRIQKNIGRSRFSSTSSRTYTYFDELEIKDGVAIVRLNGFLFCNYFIIFQKYKINQVRGR